MNFTVDQLYIKKQDKLKCRSIDEQFSRVTALGRKFLAELSDLQFLITEAGANPAQINLIKKLLSLISIVISKNQTLRGTYENFNSTTNIK